MSFTNIFPLEISKYIFSFLKPSDFIKCQLVCKDWSEVITLWNDDWRSIFKITSISSSKEKSIAQFINEHTITSFDEMFFKLNEFALNTFSNKEQGFFKCYFLPLNLQYRFEVLCGLSKEKESRKEIYVFNNPFHDACNSNESEYSFNSKEFDAFYEWKICLPCTANQNTFKFYETIEKKISKIFTEAVFEIKETKENVQKPAKKKSKIKFLKELPLKIFPHKKK